MVCGECAAGGGGDTANLSALKIAGGFALEDRGVKKMLESLLAKERAAEIVFLDPPYEEAEEYEETLKFLARHHAAVLADGAVVVAEHRARRGWRQGIRCWRGRGCWSRGMRR